MKNTTYLKSILITTICSVLSCSATCANEFQENEVIGCIEVPFYGPANDKNPLILIKDPDVYARIYALANYTENELVDVKYKSTKHGITDWETTKEFAGFFVHMYELNNPKEYKETIAVGKDFIKLENRTRIKEYFPTSRLLEAYLFTLGVQQGIFVKME